MVCAVRSSTIHHEPGGIPCNVTYLINSKVGRALEKIGCVCELVTEKSNYIAIIWLQSNQVTSNVVIITVPMYFSLLF